MNGTGLDHRRLTDPVRAVTRVLIIAVALTGLAGTSSAADARPEPLQTWIVRVNAPSLWELYSARQQAVEHGLEAEAMTEAEVRAAQATLDARLTALEGTLVAGDLQVIDRLHAVAAGFVVRGERTAAARAARLPGVTSVSLAPVMVPARDSAVPLIKADRVWQDLQLRGNRVLVAVLDTGIDYTHADFGGPGTIAAYENNDEDRVESGTFPTNVAVGGYDLAGRHYSPHASCQVPNPPGQTCHRLPRPDDDPLDSRGHGTHVAGLVAGRGIQGTVSPGVAPMARLVPLKIFGNPTGAPVMTDLLDSAFDWVFRNNIRAELPGFPTEPIQVILMGLAAAWTGGTHETRALLRAANDAGITVVTSSGNLGARPYVMGPISGGETALTVGATWAPGQHGLIYEGTWNDGQARNVSGLALDSIITNQPRAKDVGIQGSLAWMGQGCAEDEHVQPVAGRVALVERGMCAFADKIRSAEAGGATGVVVFTDHNPLSEMAGSGPLAIPAAMIDYVAGVSLRDALLGGHAVNMRVYEPDFDVLAGTIAPFSQRGPARYTPGLKPQVVAPGARLASTEVGSGREVSVESGTSMASAMAAGAAALLWERNLVGRLGLHASDVAAMLINYADSNVRHFRSDAGPMAAVTRRGAGLIDIFRAARATTVVRSEQGLAELDFGILHLAEETTQVSQKLTVRNIGDSERRYRSSFRFIFPDEDGDAGVTVAVAPETLSVGSGQSGELTVSVAADPRRVHPWPVYGREAALSPDQVGLAEIDGLVEIVEVDSGGNPVPNGDMITVPFLVTPRGHSCVRSDTTALFGIARPGDSASQRWSNPCAEDGWVNIYNLIAEDPVEPALPAALDIVSVGLRRYLSDPGDSESDIIMEWAIRTRGARRTPDAAQFRVYVDSNNDNVFDTVVYNLGAEEIGTYVLESFDPGRWLNAQAPLIEDSLEPNNFEIRTYTYQPYQLDETTTVLIASADEMGIDFRGGDVEFAFGLAAVDTVGDYPLTDSFPGFDHLPNDLATGGSIHYSQPVNDCLAFPIRVDVLAGQTAEAEVSFWCESMQPNSTFGLLFDYQANGPGLAAAETRLGVTGAAPLPSSTVYLPMTMRERGSLVAASSGGSR